MDHQSFQTGVEMINSGLKLQPAAAQLYLARGVLFVQLADFEKAQADFDKAEQLDPRQGMSAAAQGMLAEEQNQNDPDRALATVRAKLARQPEDAFLWYLQAAILSQKSPDPGSAEFAQGLDSAKRAPMDMVVTDPNMPVMNGLGLILELRKLPDYRGVPILFLTTESDAEVKKEAKAAGATGWITKPFQQDQLVALVKKVLG